MALDRESGLPHLCAVPSLGLSSPDCCPCAISTPAGPRHHEIDTRNVERPDPRAGVCCLQGRLPSRSAAEPQITQSEKHYFVIGLKFLPLVFLQINPQGLRDHQLWLFWKELKTEMIPTPTNLQGKLKACAFCLLSKGPNP